MTGHLFDVRLWPWLESCQSLQPRVQRPYRAKHVRWTNFGASFAARLLDPRLYEDRVADPANFYQRIAQHVETLRGVREYPFSGVGFGLYQHVVAGDPHYMARWNGIELMNVPHNAPGPESRGRYIIAKTVLFIAMFILSSLGWCLTYDQPMEPNLHTCSYSNEVYNSDAALMQGRVPTRFVLMPSRYVEIVQAARGYYCTGTATVAFDGHSYIQSGKTDDPGIAQLIPMIAAFTGMSLADTFDLTTFTVILLGILIGYAGFWHSYPDRQLRWAGAAVFLCLGIAEAKVADVYIFQTSPLIAGIPWVVHFALAGRYLALNLSAALLAFICSWCSLVRIGTGLICMVFLVTVFVVRFRLQKMLLPLLLIFLACSPCMLIERHLTARRDAILKSLGGPATVLNNHPIWHAIYAGLGFIPNPVVPAFNDAVAMDKVRSIDPTAAYTSPTYEFILRREVLGIAKHRPMLLIENLAAKIGIIILWASILLVPSRHLIFAEKEVLWLDAGFVLAIALSSMNAILVVPKVAYLLTFLCLTFLYSSLKLVRERFIHLGARTID